LALEAVTLVGPSSWSARLFRKKVRQEAPTLWIATGDLPETPANTFYQRLDRALHEFMFGDEVRALARPHYDMNSSKGGHPGIDPEVYFKMLMVGFFENIASERGIAARCADSFSVRAFLHYELTERTPHHSSMTVIRQRLPIEVYDAVFGLILKALKGKRLVRGKHIAIDTSVIEANAAMSSLKNRFTREEYGKYVKRLAGEAGVNAEDPRAVKRFDRKRTGRKTSNKEWENPHDPDAKVGPDKKKAIRMIYKPEHAVDMETGAVLDVELNLGDQDDAKGLSERVRHLEERMNESLGAESDVARIVTVIADAGYHDLNEMAELQDLGIRTAIPDPQHNRKEENLTGEQLQALRMSRRTLTSKSARALIKRRGELCERSFEHTLDSGGARRTTLRGRENILKRYLIQAATMNMSLLLRKMGGIGTLKWTWAASEALFDSFLALFIYERPVKPHHRSFAGILTLMALSSENAAHHQSPMIFPAS
jgi:transposase